MDQQNQNKSVPAPEDIAKAEAEAVEARREADNPAAGAAFVPYVDDVPDPVPYVDDAPQAEADEDEDYVPGAWERRIAALPEKTWRLYQRVGGAIIGVIAVLFLTVLSEDLGVWALALAFVLAIGLPNYLERWWRRKLPQARVAMLVSIAVCLAAFAVYTGLTHGFDFFTK